MDKTDDQRQQPRDEIERTQAATDAPLDEVEPADAAQQDFGARNVIMSNALQGGASPVAGGMIGTGGELGMQPSTDEELTDD
ncbi:MAG TPA: hypothetical protein VMP67_09355 [Candidatus Limnocylindria bacterium]|nr:hypothetical protein [Candidatus Limnocylindria bacterium]